MLKKSIFLLLFFFVAGSLFIEGADRNETFQKALTAFKEEKFTRAQALFQKLRKEYPGDTESLLYLGRCAQSLKKSEEAILLFTQYLSEDSLKIQWQVNLAFGAFSSLCRQNKKWVELASVSRSLLLRFEKEGENHSLLSAIKRNIAEGEKNLGTLRVQEKNFQAAVIAYQNAAVYAPEDGDLFLRLGNALLAIEEEAFAVDAYLHALKYSEPSLNRLVQIAFSLEELLDKKEYEEAQKTLSEHPVAGSVLAAIRQARNGDSEALCKAVEQAESTAGGKGVVSFRICRQLASSRRCPPELFAQTIIAFPGDRQTGWALDTAVRLIQITFPDRAVEESRNFLESILSNVSGTLAAEQTAFRLTEAVWYRLPETREILQKKAEGYRKFRENYPESTLRNTLLLREANLYFSRLEEYEKALPLFLLLVESGQRQHTPKLALCYEKQGDAASAVQILAPYVQEKPKEYGAHLQLGKVLSALGEYDRAEKIFIDLVEKSTSAIAKNAADELEKMKEDRFFFSLPAPSSGSPPLLLGKIVSEVRHLSKEKSVNSEGNYLVYREASLSIQLFGNTDSPLQCNLSFASPDAPSSFEPPAFQSRKDAFFTACWKESLPSSSLRSMDLKEWKAFFPVMERGGDGCSVLRFFERGQGGEGKVLITVKSVTPGWRVTVTWPGRGGKVVSCFPDSYVKIARTGEYIFQHEAREPLLITIVCEPSRNVDEVYPKVSVEKSEERMKEWKEPLSSLRQEISSVSFTAELSAPVVGAYLKEKEIIRYELEEILENK
ncbi:MAG: tetratricopeptide repeat protein [Candidatus Ratteibacteria bacterium]